MEETAKEQPPLPSSATGTGTAPKSKLRYPLRSAAKKSADHPAPSPTQLYSTSRRGRPASGVSRSVNVLDLSGKEKRSGKPPRRLSIPAKSLATSPSPAIPTGTITPISETRALRSNNGIRAKTLTALSDVSRSADRFRANDLSSSSYWLSQIKLSESASKHSVSLGFFKLALEAGCQPLQKMKDELRAYARRHKLENDNGQSVKELFERYNISNVPDQIQVSESCSEVPQEGTRSSDDEVHSVSSAVGTGKLKPKSLNPDAAQVSMTKSTTPKNITATRTGAFLSKSSAKSRPVVESGGHKLQKRAQTQTKQVGNKEKDKVKNGKQSASEEGPVTDALSTHIVLENKENTGGAMADVISVNGGM